MIRTIKSAYRFIRCDIGWLPLLFAFIMICKTLGFQLFPVDAVSYAALLAMAVVVLRKGINLNQLCVVFIIYIPISLLLSNPNPIFHSWARFILFLLLYIGVSPVINTRYAIGFRNRLFRGTVFFCVIVAVVSFVCYFIGVNLMKNLYADGNLEYTLNKAGTFGGITSQSMLLGPISGVGVIYCLYLWLRYKRVPFIALGVMCAGSLLFAASRSSLLSTIIAAICLLYFFSQQHGRMLKRGIVILGVLCVTSPLWTPSLEGITQKNKGDLDSGINMDSRGEKWDIRIKEWEDSPVYGIGFVAVSERDSYTWTGGIEPGSSWLALLSMTGIIGFVLFAFIYLAAIRKSLGQFTPYTSMVGSITVLLGVHMFAEGHIFSGGSFLCYLVWLSIGCATYCVNMNSNRSLQKNASKARLIVGKNLQLCSTEKS